MRIFGFNSDRLSSCGGDTRFLTNKEVLGKLHMELKSAKVQLAKLEDEMQKLADLSNAYRYNIVESVGRCFIEMDNISAIIADLNSKIKMLKDKAND